MAAEVDGRYIWRVITIGWNFVARFGGFLALVIVGVFWASAGVANSAVPVLNWAFGLIAAVLYFPYLLGIVFLALLVLISAIAASARRRQAWTTTIVQIALAALAVGIWQWTVAKGFIESP